MSQVKRASLADIFLVFKRSRNLRFYPYFIGKKGLRTCYACGSKQGFMYEDVLSDELADEWELTDRQRKDVNIRESTRCNVCKTSLRSSLHAKTIAEKITPGSHNLRQAVAQNKRNLLMAEINFCGALHPILSEMKGLY
jgi:hypothetical protein